MKIETLIGGLLLLVVFGYHPVKHHLNPEPFETPQEREMGSESCPAPPGFYDRSQHVPRETTTLQDFRAFKKLGTTEAYGD
jgi:hypothetical protein